MNEKTDKKQLNNSFQNELEYLSNADKKLFHKRFRQQRGKGSQYFHTYQELLAGGFLFQQGYTALYEKELHGRTPDWFVKDGPGEESFFADVLNFHIDRSIEEDQNKNLAANGRWGGSLPTNDKRLYGRLREKADTYNEPARLSCLPFVIFVYGWFGSFLSSEEVKYCLEWGEDALFKRYPHISGVYHMQSGKPIERTGHGYCFDFFINADAIHPISLPNGFLPLPIRPPAIDSQAELL